ncbi:hypothetical protein GALL_158060 [mine drainage metagenome]|uniref:Uncharacterized protein n=1 Tax=mine drainage metagenome TaxID=410659 RepID=A0A1J5S284_9ZZZZ
MTYTAQQIITDINSHMRQHSGTNADWYVGIATDPKQRLFNDHNVSEKNDSWIYRRATSSDVARSVEKAYLDAGCTGGPGGGDDHTDYVYAYRKTRSTRQ